LQHARQLEAAKTSKDFTVSYIRAPATLIVVNILVVAISLVGAMNI